MEWLADEPGRGTLKRAVSDYHAFAGYAAEIDPDIAVLQEVAGEEAVQRVFDSSRYHIYVTRETGVQRVALVWKKSIDLNVIDELEELGPGGLRESPDALVTVPGGSFRLLGVHLKSSCFSENLDTSRKAACITLRGQMDIVEAWMEARHAEGTPFAVLGDFNRRFSDRDDAWADLNDDTPAGFKLVAPTVGRTARCRDGRYKDFIDHIVMSDSLARRMVPGSFQQWNYRSWDPPVLSDHCPIGVNLR
jgi:endonuclease/exonuclease/phosphatase family metal-dependent hydrolase